ncbi:shikimate kinase AroK [Sinimarinibacterium flocculans]|uniref:Shikimate kinase n=1 Tax=Sinimarinibacterium flocculans TaxID=985250 RepID=A0A318E4J6_9GAMM|nr:shikimate kinase AroK [Sinimarinibacterium flocculans]PXV64863.1 shikimate kinase [Sinimarinibacterium flocculans]
MAQGPNIFLVGPMGAGKTTVGRRLAQIRGVRFVDSDHEIERRTGVDIPYIFEREGEAGFRRREAQAIAELSGEGPLVLATGGGAVLDPENRRVLAARGTVIYLHASVEQQLARTQRSEARPLLAQAADRREVLERLFRQRDPLYREIADLVVSTDARSAKCVVRDIADFVDGRPSG